MPGASSCRFLGVELALAPGVLVPRRETELLGRSAIDILRPMPERRASIRTHKGRSISLIEHRNDPKTAYTFQSDALGAPIVIDMCCGSGNLALAIAHHCPNARLWAADLTDETVALAKINVARLSLAGRVAVRQGDLFGAFAGDGLAGTVDMVVCNPPYISSARLDGRRAHLLAQEPREAFDGGPYGISILQRLVREAVGFVRPGGWLLCEFGEGQERQAAALVARTRAYEEPSFAFIDGKPRVMIARLQSGPGT